MYETFIDRKFSASSELMIEQAEVICLEYARQGYDLSLRQLYYQFVSKGWIANSDKNYKRMSSVLNDARLAGRIDWDHMVDRTRGIVGSYAGHEEDPEDVLRSAAESYFEDLWAGQPVRVEVWVEKEALAGVMRRACSGLRVGSFPNKGYVSVSAMYRAAKRIDGYREQWGQDCIILHLGDHDPSGIDMSRDIEDRLTLMSAYGGANLEVRRIALNMDQIRAYNPPPNPAKITDSRARDYIATYGNESWELDALEPGVLVDLVQDHVRREMDDDAWDAAIAQEQSVRDRLVALAEGLQ